MSLVWLNALTKGLTSRNLSFMQQVEILSIDRPYSKFSIMELKATTANFSSSKFKSHQAKYHEFLDIELQNSCSINLFKNNRIIKQQDSLTRVVHSLCFAQKVEEERRCIIVSPSNVNEIWKVISIVCIRKCNFTNTYKIFLCAYIN